MIKPSLTCGGMLRWPQMAHRALRATRGHRLSGLGANALCGHLRGLCDVLTPRQSLRAGNTKYFLNPGKA